MLNVRSRDAAAFLTIRLVVKAKEVYNFTTLFQRIENNEEEAINDGLLVCGLDLVDYFIIVLTVIYVVIGPVIQ